MDDLMNALLFIVGILLAVLLGPITLVVLAVLWVSICNDDKGQDNDD